MSGPTQKNPPFSGSHHAPEHAALMLHKGRHLYHAGDLRGAEAAFREVLQVSPQDPNALEMLGLIACRSGNFEVAVRLFDFVTGIEPRYDTYFNRGLALRALGRHPQALESLEHAIELHPESANAYLSRGIVLHEMKRYAEALVSYEKVLAVRPEDVDALSNRGSALRALGRLDEAYRSFEQAMALKPQGADAYYNFGNLLMDLRQFPAAVECFDRAVERNPQLADAYNNRGSAYQSMQVHAKALENFEHALRLKPELPYLLGSLIHMRRSLCIWRDAEKELRMVEQMLAAGKRVIYPFAVVPISDSAALQKKAAEIYVAEACAHVPAATPIDKYARHDRIRIGYYSSDFRNHAVSYHMAEVFEGHDRERFEILGFSSGLDTGDEMRKRVSAGMDRFIDVREMADADVVRMSRSLEIDIAVNLTGLTHGDRIQMFAQRLAPVQVNYLGYPATMGTGFMDYIVADTVLVPEENRQYYAEKIAYVSGCFQANDSRRIVGRECTRASQGLPDTGFIFCCFNNCAKITPEMFGVWMRILSRVPGSVLWLLASNEEAQQNLRLEAKKRGVAEERLVFASTVPLAEHLGRQRLADLFLDTLPFNAGATASPALWEGLPILTCAGQSFAGRMGASLLSAIGMQDLITTAAGAYEERAVEIGLKPEVARELKERLERNRHTTPLFDTAAFTRNLERVYAAMYERYQADQAPDHIAAANESA